MEIINECSILVAKALDNLKVVQCEDCEQAASLGDAIIFLENALVKLTNAM